jgi:hypothetical protein
MGHVIARIVDELLTSFKKNYKRPRVWIGLLSVFFCLVLLFPYVDSNIFYYSRIQNRIDVLESVMELDEVKINKNSIYKEEYQSILQEIGRQKEYTVNSIWHKFFSYIEKIALPPLKSKQGNSIIKFITGALWCIVLDIGILFSSIKFSEKILTLILMLIITMGVGTLFALIPVVVIPWINYIGIPVIQLVLIILWFDVIGKTPGN